MLKKEIVLENEKLKKDIKCLRHLLKLTIPQLHTGDEFPLSHYKTTDSVLGWVLREVDKEDNA